MDILAPSSSDEYDSLVDDEVEFFGTIDEDDMVPAKTTTDKYDLSMSTKSKDILDFPLRGKPVSPLKKPRFKPQKPKNINRTRRRTSSNDDKKETDTCRGRGSICTECVLEGASFLHANKKRKRQNETLPGSSQTHPAEDSAAKPAAKKPAAKETPKAAAKPAAKETPKAAAKPAAKETPKAAAMTTLGPRKESLPSTHKLLYCSNGKTNSMDEDEEVDYDLVDFDLDEDNDPLAKFQAMREVIGMSVQHVDYLRYRVKELQKTNERLLISVRERMASEARLKAMQEKADLQQRRIQELEDELKGRKEINVSTFRVTVFRGTRGKNY